MCYTPIRAYPPHPFFVRRGSSRTLIENAVQSCLSISKLPPSNAAKARLMRAKARLAAGLHVGARQGRSSPLWPARARALRFYSQIPLARQTLWPHSNFSHNIQRPRRSWRRMSSRQERYVHRFCRVVLGDISSPRRRGRSLIPTDAHASLSHRQVLCPAAHHARFLHRNMARNRALAPTARPQVPAERAARPVAH